MATRFISSYLREVRARPKLFKTLQARYLTNVRLVLLLVFSIIVIGIFGYITIPRKLNPEINIAIVSVNTLLAGANPKDIESLLTIPLEDKIRGVKNIDTMTSISSQGNSSIAIQFVTGEDKDKARNDIQAAVNQATLPADAKTPSVRAFDFENAPVWTFSVTAKTDSGSLSRFSQILKKRLENSPNVDSVSLSGISDQEVDVIIDEGKVASYGINPILLSQKVTSAINSFPSGNLETPSQSYSLTIDPLITTAGDIRNIELTFQDKTVKLGDIATIMQRAKPRGGRGYLATPTKNPQDAVTFSVFKVSSQNIDKAEKAMKKVVHDTIGEYHNDFEVTTLTNTNEQVTKQFNELTNEFISTIILVFINLFLFLGFRQAVISSMTVPLTLLSSIGVINILGYSLNFLTSFAFLIALGLLIDDTIVTVAAMTRYWATRRFTPTETGLLVWQDFIVPLWSTTITTIWAFVPLLLAGGIIGEFIKPIPVVVTTTMLSSTSVAVLITLPLMMVILKPRFPKRVKALLRITGIALLFLLGFLLLPKSSLFPIELLTYIVFLLITYRVRKTLTSSLSRYFKKGRKKKALAWFKRVFSHGLIDVEDISIVYIAIIERILRSKKAMRRTLIAIVLFAVVSYLLVPLGLVKNEFFPKTDQDTIFISVELPNGTAIAKTNEETLSLLKKVRNTPFVTSVVGQSGATFNSTNAQTQNDESSFFLTLNLIPHEKRRTPSFVIAQRLRDQLQTYQKGTVSVVEESGGPPAGADVALKLSGDDLSVLNSYADTIVAFLKKQPGTANVGKSIKQGTSSVVFVPDQAKIDSAGLSEDTVGLWLRSYASGFTLKTTKFDNTDTDITFYLDPLHPTPEAVTSLTLPTKTGSIPLSSLGTFKLEHNPTQITRENNKRTISVTATVLKGYVATEKNKQVGQFADSLHLPSGYSWSTGGANEQNQKSVQSILQAMILSFILILITMVIEFHSFRQAVIVLLTIPLAISGVFYVFALTGIPLSFPALIGILALFGIVVTTAIVIVEKINDNRKHGMPLKKAIIDASGSRLEPILLTSLTSILGLLPITLSNPLWQGLGGAIIAGLLFTGVIKLFFIPIVYYEWYK